MRKIELEQGSDAWKLYRMEHDNASEAGALMGVAPTWMQIHTPYQLWQYKQGDIDVEENDFMRHGTALEPEARKFLEKEFEIELSPAVFEDGKYSASLDGYWADGVKSIKAEIKCPMSGQKSAAWKMGIKREIPIYYYWQIVHQEMVCPTDLTLYCVYLSPENVQYFSMESLKPDWKKDVATLRNAWESFNRTPPEPDWEDRADQVWLDAEQHYIELKRASEVFADQLKEAKDNLIKLTNTNRVRGAKLEMSYQPRVGSVQYKKIPALEDINLDDYRGKSSSTWVIRERN